MSNHSPGPWFVGAQNDALFVIDRPPRHFTDNPLPEGGLTITIAAVAMLKHPIAEANARLIAAAPALLEAVKRIVQEDEAGEITGGAIEDCKQAIEKAEAES